MHAVTTPQPATPPASHDPDASAGGRLVSTDGRALPLTHAHLSVEARGGIARAVLTQHFHNPHAEALSVRYLLPLPARAAVAGFAFNLGETRVVGEVQPRQRAREIFEKAVVQGRTAALVEEDRSTLFTQKVGNIPPGAELVCELVLDQQLSWLEGGRWAWRFPTVVGPRYQGTISRVADAAKLSVPVAAGTLPARATFELSIGDALTGAVASPSHTVVAESEDGEARVRLADGRGCALDRDVVVEWPVAAPAVGLGLAAARPSAPAHLGRTYGLLTVVPPAAPMTPRARDLTLLIDTSGSMGGRPLDQAKRVMAAMIERLGKRDRIEMISFGSRPVRFRTEPIAATRDGRKAALKWLRKLRASGGTEMHTAVLEALRPLRADAQRQIVLVTDGYIGFESEIIGRLLTDLPPDCRLHTIGVGSAPNRTLTEGAARAGRGTELIVGLGEDPDAAAARMVARTAAPIVTELVIEGAGLAELSPMQLPDLYAGTPALLGVACSQAGPLTLKGRTADGAWTQTIEVPKLALGEGPMGVAALFGRNRVDDLDLRITAGEPIGAIDPQIEQTGVDFQIATRKTSWVAVTEEVTVGEGIGRREEEQPHALPHGATAEGFGLRAPAAQAPELAASLMLGGTQGMRRARAGAPMPKKAKAVFGSGGAPSTPAPPGAPPPPSAPAPARFEAEESLAESGFDLDDDFADAEFGALEADEPTGVIEPEPELLFRRDEAPAAEDERSRAFAAPSSSLDPSAAPLAGGAGLPEVRGYAPPAAKRSRPAWLRWLVLAIIIALGAAIGSLLWWLAAPELPAPTPPGESAPETP